MGLKGLAGYWVPVTGWGVSNTLPAGTSKVSPFAVEGEAHKVESVRIGGGAIAGGGI